MASALTDHDILIPLSPFVRYAHYFRTGEGFRIPQRVIYDHLGADVLGMILDSMDRLLAYRGRLLLFRAD